MATEGGIAIEILSPMFGAVRGGRENRTLELRRAIVYMPRDYYAQNISLRDDSQGPPSDILPDTLPVGFCIKIQSDERKHQILPSTVVLNVNMREKEMLN